MIFSEGHGIVGLLGITASKQIPTMLIHPFDFSVTVEASKIVLMFMRAMADINVVLKARLKTSARANDKDTTAKDGIMTVKNVASKATLSPEQAEELRGALERMRQESTSGSCSLRRNTLEVLAWVTHSDHMCAVPVSNGVRVSVEFYACVSVFWDVLFPAYMQILSLVCTVLC